MKLLVAPLSFGNSTTTVAAGASQFIADRFPAWDWTRDAVVGGFDAVVEWAGQPHILALIIAWWITFTVVLVLLLVVGFGPIGIGAGTLAAAFQSWAYGAFTPAGGFFAILTSMGMLGVLMPLGALAAAVVATMVTVIVWACRRD